jgi:hypothetical protein
MDAHGNGYDIYDLYDLGEFDQKGAVPTKWGTWPCTLVRHFADGANAAGRREHAIQRFAISASYLEQLQQLPSWTAPDNSLILQTFEWHVPADRQHWRRLQSRSDQRQWPCTLVRHFADGANAAGRREHAIQRFGQKWKQIEGRSPPLEKGSNL